MKYKLEIIFAQFNAANRGWTSGKHPSFSLNRRLDPTYTQVKQYFPDAKLNSVSLSEGVIRSIV